MEVNLYAYILNDGIQIFWKHYFTDDRVIIWIYTDEKAHLLTFFTDEKAHLLTFFSSLLTLFQMDTTLRINFIVYYKYHASW